MSLMPLQPGSPAPEFTLPAIHHEGSVSLDDYRGRTAVLLCFFRGLSCPFCRRQIAQLGAVHAKLLNEGVESLGIITTPVSRARLFSRYRPAKLPLASDVQADTHRAFGVPRFDVVDDTAGEKAAWPNSIGVSEVMGLRVNPFGLLPEPVSMDDAAAVLNRIDGFVPEAEDIQSGEAHWNQLGGLFLVGPDTIVRWSFIEGSNHVTEIGSFPSEDDLLGAARSLRG